MLSIPHGRTILIEIRQYPINIIRNALNIGVLQQISV
jgi:hypothetical protein